MTEAQNDTTNRLRISLSRWRALRRDTLGGLLIAGMVVSSLPILYHASISHVNTTRAASNTRSYDGVGLYIKADPRHGGTYVQSVVPGGPADGLIEPGAYLITANGSFHDHPRAWAGALRGNAGTEVVVQVAYPDRGHECVRLVRDTISLPR